MLAKFSFLYDVLFWASRVQQTITNHGTENILFSFFFRHGGNRSDDSGCNSESDNDDASISSGLVSDDPDVVAVLKHVAPPLEAVAAESDAELEDIFDDHAVGPVVGPPVAHVVDAVPDHALVAMEVAAPVWDVGVELAEFNRHGKSKCMYCGDNTAKCFVRFKYFQSNRL